MLFIYLILLLLLAPVLNGQTEVNKAEYLVVSGNDPQSGGGKVWIKSNLMATSTVVKIADNRAVSSACGLHPARCRTLMVNSTQYDDYRSSHIVFVPLENGLYTLYLELMYSNRTVQQLPGYSLSIDYDRTTILEFSESNCPSNCASLGVYEVGVQYYSLCASLPSALCTCELSITLGNGYTLRRCHTFTVVLGSTFEQISDIVSLSGHRLLMFLVGNISYQLNPIDRSIQVSDSRFIQELCATVTQLRVDNARDILYIYCTNNVSIIYNLEDNSIIKTLERQFFYPCSIIANITVSLPTIVERRADITYKEEDRETHTFLPAGGANFISGVCITYREHYIFLYSDRNGGTYLYNATTNTFSNLLSRTQACDQCEQPLVFGKRYPVVIDHEQGAVSVFNLENFSVPLIALYQASPQLVTLIHNLSFPEAQVSPTQGTTMFPLDSNSKLATILSPVFGVLLLGTVATVIVVVAICLWRKRHSDSENLARGCNSGGQISINNPLSNVGPPIISVNENEASTIENVGLRDRNFHTGHDADNDRGGEVHVLEMEPTVEPQQEQSNRPTDSPNNSDQQLLPSSRCTWTQ